ncbi:MAG: hypothetical protein JWR07_2443 [Nevskia sp.]|jgi:quinol monooxygenase YgiN|nr:hypothetical protein [Nevskia sp.]
MIGGMKIMSVKPGREKQFEQLFRELREEIRKNEPGCMAYVLLSSRMTRDSYVLHEQYADQAALDAHRASVYGARYFPVIRSLLTGIEVEYFDGVVE